MKHIPSHKLESAVSSICVDVEDRLDFDSIQATDCNLWRELSVCLLSSQVSYELALAAGDRIAELEILSNSKSTCVSAVTIRLQTVLREPMNVNGRRIVYRFYNSKARQLARTWQAIQAAGGIRNLIYCNKDPSQIRDWFVVNAPGMGPKQSSMFIRNSGVSYDLAILDRHVLNYMSIIGLIDGNTQTLGQLKTYNRLEGQLQIYAAQMGVKVGLLDWAIWIVMRAAKNVSISGDVE